MATTVLNARVREKIATETYWLSIEDELGVILSGEAVYVWDNDTDQNPVNFKLGDGTKKFSELPYFIARYNDVANCKVLAYLEQTGEISIPTAFRNKSHIFKFIVLNNDGGDVDFKLGTSSGGSQIAEIEIPTGPITINFDNYFTTPTPVYLSAGTNFSVFILYYQLDEQPVIPSSGGVTTFKRWAYGTVYAFRPKYVGHTGDSWDLISGLGKPGTDYEGAILEDLPETYLVGAKTGDTIGGPKGQNDKNIVFENLPSMKITLPGNVGGVPGSGGITFGGANNNPLPLGITNSAGNPFSGQTALNVQPKSMIVLYFTGLPTTT